MTVDDYLKVRKTKLSNESDELSPPKEKKKA
jgi:hypothetical protein